MDSPSAVQDMSVVLPTSPGYNPHRHANIHSGGPVPDLSFSASGASGDSEEMMDTILEVDLATPGTGTRAIAMQRQDQPDKQQSQQSPHQKQQSAGSSSHHEDSQVEAHLGIHPRTVRLNSPQHEDSPPSFSLQQITSRQAGVPPPDPLARTSGSPSFLGTFGESIRSRAGIILIIFWIIWVVAYLILAVSIAAPAQSRMNSRVLTQCQVTKALVTPFRVGSSYDLTLDVRFQTTNAATVDTRVSYRHIDTDIFEGARRLSDFDVGKSTACYYDPDDPASVVMMRSITVTFLAVHILFSVIGVVSFSLTLVVMISKWRSK